MNPRGCEALEDPSGHLFEAGKAQTAAQINAWFHAADTERRVAQLKTDA